jgi:hypothetical protein
MDETGRQDAGETLLMTATFHAPDTPYLVLRDESARIRQYMAALVAWARTSRVRRIIFAENSGTRFDFSRIVAHLEAAGKEVELIVFDGNAGSPRFGKGYGEGVILEHAFAHSRLLRRADTFYKVTGRLFVRNFDEVSAATTSRHAFKRKYGKPGNPSKVDTTFYKCGLDLFESRLMDAYRDVDDMKRVFIEHQYFDRLRDTDVGGFPLAPETVGESASTGKIYAPYDEDVISTARTMSPQLLDK